MKVSKASCNKQQAAQQPANTQIKSNHYREDPAKGGHQPMKPVMMEIHTSIHHYREDPAKGGYQPMKPVMMEVYTNTHHYREDPAKGGT